MKVQGTYSANKNEILFSRFGLNYNKEPALFRKGSVVFRDVRPYGHTNVQPKLDQSLTLWIVSEPKLRYRQGCCSDSFYRTSR